MTCKVDEQKMKKWSKTILFHKKVGIFHSNYSDTVLALLALCAYSLFWHWASVFTWFSGFLEEDPNWRSLELIILHMYILPLSKLHNKSIRYMLIEIMLIYNSILVQECKKINHNDIELKFFVQNMYFLSYGYKDTNLYNKQILSLLIYMFVHVCIV